MGLLSDLWPGQACHDTELTFFSFSGCSGTYNLDVAPLCETLTPNP